MIRDDAEPRTLGWAGWAALFLAGVATIFVGLGSKTLSQHEVFAAQPAREMLRYGHWIVPMFAGSPRVTKPPATGWLIAAAMKLTGSEAEWVARLPAAVAGVACAQVIAFLAARHFGRRVGIVTGLIQLTCFYTVMQSRLAEADMIVAAAVAGAFLCLALGTLPGESPSRGRSFVLGVAFHFFAGLVFLLKGVPLLFVLLGALAWAVVRRERRVTRFLLNPAGLLVLAAMLLSWPWMAYREMPGIVDVWRRELSREGHDADPFYKYLIDIPTVLLPWTPLILIGAWLAIRRRVWRTPLGQFLLCWVVPGIVALHFGGQKSKHYPIPMVPPLSILGAFGLVWLVRLQQANPRATRLIGAALWVLGIAAAAVAVFFLRKTRPMAPEIAVVLSLLAVGGVVAIWREARRDLDGQLAAILATAIAMVAGVNVLIIGRHFDDFDFARRFAAEVNAAVPEGRRIYIIDAQKRVDPQVAYYLRGPAWRFPDEGKFLEFARGYRGGAIHVVGIEDHADDVLAAGDASVVVRAPRKQRREEAYHRWVLYEVRPKRE